ncbi:prephenate dehydrogenase [Novipirellula aureliae]|uniref:Prephenate dehydrogenase n=1 Tax=Novipirellula aureliae TaxID=2527966 RepID=A0A5C6ECL7_9BACT|nr:prephenate dehydrogenase [Novipirellula aureliae]TWU45687.1 prephenate dehydrogenase [Novipirellula aureliae]
MQVWPSRIAIVGVGLLGASVAKSIRRRVADMHVVGVVRNPEKRHWLVDSGILDSATDSLSEGCRDADVVVVATPVDRIADFVQGAAADSPPECLITDVGSTKQGIVDAVINNALATGKFVAAHPVAGSEKTGADHAIETLFDGKVTILTPSEKTPAEFVKKAETFWQLTGSRTSLLRPDEHDLVMAAVSHVPHLASSAVARLVNQDSADFIGSGWCDITRVAAGDPGMWLAICKENRSAIEQQLAKLVDSINDCRRMLIENDDAALLRWLDEAKTIRDNI